MAAYRWFGCWLKGAEDNALEVDLPLATEEKCAALRVDRLKFRREVNGSQPESEAG
jgi:hypothetical protein